MDKSSNGRGRQWDPRFFQKERRRIGLGFLFGSLIGAALHLLTRDSRFVPLLTSKWVVLWSNQNLDNAGTYKVEFEILCIGLAVVIVPPMLLWLVRFSRSWWA